MAETSEQDLVDYTAENDIAFIPYGPLGANPMQKGAKLDLGTEHEERAIYAIAGQISVAGTEYPTGHILVIKQDQAAVIEAISDAHVVLIGGARLDGVRHIWWNFVASSKQRIEEAKADWREGRFATIPGDEDEFIPLPDA